MLQIKQSQTVICSIVKTKMRATKKIILLFDSCRIWRIAIWHGNVNISASHCHATYTPNAAISSINFTLEIIKEMGSESKLYSEVVGFRVLHIEINVR